MFCFVCSFHYKLLATSVQFHCIQPYYVLNALNGWNNKKSEKRFLGLLNIMNYMGISLHNAHQTIKAQNQTFFLRFVLSCVSLLFYLIALLLLRHRFLYSQQSQFLIKLPMAIAMKMINFRLAHTFDVSTNHISGRHRNRFSIVVAMIELELNTFF